MRKILKSDGVSEGQGLMKVICTNFAAGQIAELTSNTPDLSDSSCDRCLLACVVYRYCICADQLGGVGRRTAACNSQRVSGMPSNSVRCVTPLGGKCIRIELAKRVQGGFREVKQNVALGGL